MPEHPYITAYNELNNYTAVAKRFDTNDKAVRKIVHPEKHAALAFKKNEARREKNWRKNNRKWIITRLEYLNKLNNEREEAVKVAQKEMRGKTA